jgi:hypothetical protein
LSGNTCAAGSSSLSSNTNVAITETIAALTGLPPAADNAEVSFDTESVDDNAFGAAGAAGGGAFNGSITGSEVLDRVTHQRYLHTGSGTNDFSGIIDFRALPGSSPRSVAGKAATMVVPPPYSKRLERLDRVTHQRYLLVLVAMTSQASSTFVLFQAPRLKVRLARQLLW